MGGFGKEFGVTVDDNLSALVDSFYKLICDDFENANECTGSGGVCYFCDSDEYYTHWYNYLADVIGIVTYDGDLTVRFLSDIFDSVYSICIGDTFNFISNESNYIKYIIVCNLPFLKNRLEWGGSIRGAWICCDNPTLIKFTHSGDEKIIRNSTEMRAYYMALCLFHKMYSVKHLKK